MFTRMLLKNFKGWEDTGSLRLAPITVFFGSNSSGKTSLLQAILLLKQTAESADRSRVLHPGDDRSLVDLGTVADLLHGHDLTQALDILLAWTLADTLELPNRVRPKSMQFQAEVRVAPDGQPFVQKLQYLTDRAHAAMTRQDNGSYELSAVPKPPRRKGRAWPLPPPLKFYGFPDEVSNYFQNVAWLADLVLELEHQLARVHYVGPLREYPQRSYLWAGEKPENVGPRGRFAVPALLAATHEHRRIGRGEGKGTRYESFEETVARWLKQMGVIDWFAVQPIAKGRKDYEVRVRRTPSSAEVAITDVGFGVSQVLPVIVQCYYASRHSTVIFEQPEIHLHPRVQADLADLFIDAVKCCGVQFIVESHSEHFLRRLQRRIAEEVVTNEQVALHVCDVQGGRSTIAALDVDEYGNITNWPKDFFGDEIGDLAAMTEAALRRKREA